MPHYLNLLRAYKTELGIIALSLAVHLICFAFVIAANDGDITAAVRGDDGYFELAQNVLAGNGFSWSAAPPYEPNPLRTPGYIYVLAALIGITGSVAAAAVIQLLLSSAIPVLGMHIAERITRSKKIGFTTGLILVLDPTLALLSFQFYTETVFLLLFLPALVLTLRYIERPCIRPLFISAVLLGAAILTKTSAQFVPFIIVPFIIWSVGRTKWRTGVMHSAFFLCVIGAVLTPWIMRNMDEFGVPGLSAQSSFVLYTNLVPAVLSVAENTDFTETVHTFLTPAEFKGDAITLANGSEYSAKAVAIVREHPAALAYVGARSLFTFFTNDGFYALLLRSGYAPQDFLPLLIGARLVWIAITLGAFLGAFLYFMKERSRLAVLTIVLTAYFALTSMVAAFGTNPRYRLPVDPIILAYAGVGAVYVLGHMKRIKDSISPFANPSQRRS